MMKDHFDNDKIEFPIKRTKRQIKLTQFIYPCDKRHIYISLWRIKLLSITENITHTSTWIYYIVDNTIQDKHIILKEDEDTIIRYNLRYTREENTNDIQLNLDHQSSDHYFKQQWAQWSFIYDELTSCGGKKTSCGKKNKDGWWSDEWLSLIRIGCTFISVFVLFTVETIMHLFWGEC